MTISIGTQLQALAREIGRVHINIRSADDRELLARLSQWRVRLLDIADKENMR